MPDSILGVQLLWGLLALPIVALYYWTFRRQREEVATFALWNKALARRSTWSRWRRIVSLGLQLSILALIVAALAQLDWSPRARGIRTIVLVVDSSASMKAIDVHPSRFAKSRAEAHRVVKSLGRDERAAIITAGAVPKLLLWPTDDKEQLNRVLSELMSTDEPGQIEPAVDLAERMLAGAPNPRVVVFTDGRFAGVKALSERKNVEFKIAGGEANNIALTRLAARPSQVGLDDEVLIEAMNFSPVAATVRATLSLSGQRVETVTLDVPPNGKAQKVIEAKLAAGGLLTAQLDPGDDFPIDDQAITLIAPRREISCVLAGNDGTPLAMALRKTPQVDLQVISDASRKLPAADVTVFDGPTPDVLPPGGVLVIAPTRSCDLWEFESAVEERLEFKSQSREPPLAGVDLSSAVLEELVRLKFKQPTQTLAAVASGEPLLSIIERHSPERHGGRSLHDGNVLVWHVRLEKTDLTQRSAFPLFISQAIHLLAKSQPVESLASTTGERTEAVADKTPDAAWTPPTSVGPNPQGATTLLNEVGVWQRKSGDAGSPSAAVAVNLFNPRESDLRTGDEITAGPPTPGGHWFDAPLWTLFLLGTLLLSLVDWFFLHRRVLV